MLWVGGRLTAVVDWTYASWGPPGVDLVEDGTPSDALPEEHVAALEAHTTRALDLLAEHSD